MFLKIYPTNKEDLFQLQVIYLGSLFKSSYGVNNLNINIIMRSKGMSISFRQTESYTVSSVDKAHCS